MTIKMFAMDECNDYIEVARVRLPEAMYANEPITTVEYWTVCERLERMNPLPEEYRFAGFEKDFKTAEELERDAKSYEAEIRSIMRDFDVDYEEAEDMLLDSLYEEI